MNAATPPHLTPSNPLWFWFISLVLTGEETAFQRLIVLLLLLVVTLLALALVAKTWAGLIALISGDSTLGGSLAGAYTALQRRVRELSATRRRDGL